MTQPSDMAAFVRIVDLGGLAPAARDLGLTPSAMSKQLGRLEARLGVRLLTRTTRRIGLTPEGETYLARARDILSLIEAAEQDVTAGRGRPGGLLRVNTGTAFARHRLIPLLPAFFARYPGITLDLGVTDRRVDLIADQVDVLLRTGALGDRRCWRARSPAAGGWSAPRRPTWNAAASPPRPRTCWRMTA